MHSLLSFLLPDQAGEGLGLSLQNSEGGGNVPPAPSRRSPGIWEPRVCRPQLGTTACAAGACFGSHPVGRQISVPSVAACFKKAEPAIITGFVAVVFLARTCKIGAQLQHGSSSDATQHRALGRWG